MKKPFPLSVRRGFTLVEVLLSSVLLLVIVLIVVGMINAASKTYRNMNTQVGLFQESSVVFDSVTRNVGEATLKTYLDYYPNQAPTAANPKPPKPQKYLRNSELHFIAGPATYSTEYDKPLIYAANVPGLTVSPSHAVFFQAPLDYTVPPTTGPTPSPGTTPVFDPARPDYSNTGGLLTGCGYFVSYGENQSLNIPGLKSDVKKRFRLMRLFEPTESLEVYNTLGIRWFNDALANGHYRSIADNVIALFIAPKATATDEAAYGAAIAPKYFYDTRGGLDKSTGQLQSTQPIQQHQLPPLLHVTMVAIDEASAVRLAAMTEGAITSDIFGDAQFTNPGVYDNDMASMTKAMDKLRINYRIFSSDVPMRGAKWSAR